MEDMRLDAAEIQETLAEAFDMGDMDEADIQGELDELENMDLESDLLGVPSYMTQTEVPAETTATEETV
ncbi:Snf7 family protein [Kipferlia bialata]|uniref:Snf7 family protein n=1 Tax=Kipferlia bialata TaxID=797122 RepID=A0A9K3D9C0_9EUKA|nr:Snf7 family protein [Kipferlia bialata]|eukprot:g13461.t1